MRFKFLIGLCMACLVSPVFGNVHIGRDVQTVTSGVELIVDEFLGGNGWLDVFVLQVDLENENVSVGPIFPDEFGVKGSVYDLASDALAVAGVNGDFFSLSSAVPSFGPMFNDGEVISAYTSSTAGVGPYMDMGTLLITDDNILMDYFECRVAMMSDGEFVGFANSFNKVGAHLSMPIVLDERFYGSIDGIFGVFDGVAGFVVDDGVVAYHGEVDEVILPPEGGFVVLMHETFVEEYFLKFPIGSSFDVRVETFLDNTFVNFASEFDFGIGGGGLIMKNGSEFLGAADVVGRYVRNPRTVVANTFDGKLLLIGIDGRGESIGVTHSELITLLKNYGVRDAMYLDGGGSTTVVARNEGEFDLSLLNSPSDGAMRNVVNGVGIFSNNVTQDIDKLLISGSNDRTFVGEEIELFVSGVDEFFNPVSVDGVELLVNGVDGYFVGSTFVAKSGGEGVIIARIGDIEVEFPIYVSESPIGIVAEFPNLNLGIGEARWISIFGIDDDGFRIRLDNAAVNWRFPDGILVEGRVLTGESTGTFVVSASAFGLNCEIGVLVGDAVVAIQSFEEVLPIWGGDTTEVFGSVEPSELLKFHGERAVKLSYSFLPSLNRQVAFCNFDEEILLPDDTLSFNLWVNGNNQGDGLSVEIIDDAGQVFFVKLCDEVNFLGWKFLSATLPEDVVLPARVSKLCVFSEGTSFERNEVLYFDHASITRGLRGDFGNVDYLFDPMFQEEVVLYDSHQNIINVVGSTLGIGIEGATRLLLDADMVVLASKSNSELLTGNNISFNMGYFNAFLEDTVQVIMIDSSRGGIMASDENGWSYLKETLAFTPANHVIITTELNPLTEFTDVREGNALHDVLVDFRNESGKDIFVVNYGKFDRSVDIIDGIRYIGADVAEFVQFQVLYGDIFYSFVPF